MKTKLFRRLLWVTGFCSGLTSGLFSPVEAQTNYESYTFLTWVGPQESPGWFDEANTEARFSGPTGVAIDGAGNTYVADTSNHTIRKVSSSGVVTTLAGSPGRLGTNDGVGSNARFYYPKSVAVDGSGNVFVTDTSSHTIRKITPVGVVSTFAGSPIASGTNDGLGASARFNFPIGMATDNAGNIFVADSYNHVIRKITSGGMVSTLAGSALNPGTSNGTGSAARFNTPFDVALDTNGNVFVADTYNHAIRMITSAGVVSSLAGGLATNLSGSADGAGSAARFNYPTGVATDTNRNVYVADYSNHTIRKVTPAGVVTKLAGMEGVYGHTNGTGSAARFYLPAALKVDLAGNVYIADSYNNMVRKMTAATVVTTLAGNPGGLGTNDSSGNAARFNYPSAVAVDLSNNVYVADYANHTIRKITPARVVTTLAGQATVSGSVNGTGTAASFNRPTGIAVDTNGTLYVADTYNHVIRKITPAGVVTTFAGTAAIAGTNNGTGSAARFHYPFAIAITTNSTLYVADTYSQTIRKITSAGVVTTLAGSPTLAGTNDGVGSAARFSYPEGIAADAAGNVYVADDGSHTIRKVTAAGSVTTLAGAAGTPGFGDGVGTNAYFYSPFGVAVDAAGNVYVGDYNNSLIRKITPAGVVTTLAGAKGGAGFLDGSGIAARFNTPEGVAVGPDGSLYVADASNHAIRKGYAAPPDVPVVDLPSGKSGLTRHLGVSNVTTTSWAWNMIRRPADSAAFLSATNTSSPTFTPDLPQSYVVRFRGTDSLGRQAVGLLELAAIGLIEPRISAINKIGADLVLTGSGGAPGATYSVLVSTNLGLPVGSWTVLPGNQFNNNGEFVFTNALNGMPRAYQIKVP